MLSSLKLTPLLALVVVASSVSGYSDDGSCVDPETIEPCELASLLDVGFGDCGVRVSPEKANEAPRVTFAQAQDDQKYLLIMVDPDAPSRSQPKYRYWRHWVVADISGSSLKTGHIDGRPLTKYSGPSPPENSGPHRYRFFLFEQFGDLQYVSTLGDKNRGKWQFDEFIRRNDLCDALIAAYEFTAQNP